ncbi:metallophosphatase family protein [Paenibacillus sp. TRM 82003]|nr:metallophosphatase family protein [Paenibacillus sp. TRM 82003]
MDRIAIISDIHGNMPALDAVLEDMKQRNIERIFCLGDLVGKGPHSDRAVDAIRMRCQAVVRGNWDEFIGEPTDQETLLWHQAKLGEERIRYLAALPFSHEFDMSGRRIRLFHASEESVHVRVQPWDSLERRLQMFAPHGDEESAPDVVAYGDVHNAYVQHLKGRTLINVGSVGNPLDIPQAAYVILEGTYGSRETAAFSIQIVRVPYDIELAVRQAEDEGMPALEAYAKELRTAVYRGRA